MTRSEAETILRQFICNKPTQPLDDATIREAVLIVRDLSDYQIFGICAETAEAGIQALSQYLAALKYETAPDIRSLSGVIYIKYNPMTGRAHIEPYTGEHRAVLLSCQSAYDDGVNETFGHLPLNLFEQ
ncbi:MAG: DUF1824 domain-containing protein [Leptolyngbya sp. ERB_1_1]